MKGLLGLASLLISENLIPGHIERKPEELLVMDSPEQVTAWHAQGADEGPMLPIYHLNALACSRLLPGSGMVVDLGCGSGRFSAYLARRRPDLKVVGFDLSKPMVDLGNAAIRESGLGDRVELRVGDMTSFASALPPETALVACQFALHHLPTLQHVDQCISQLAVARALTDCALWVFDLVRPRHASTVLAYPEILTPDAPEVFRLDSTNSLRASYAHAELAEVIDRVFGRSSIQSAVAKIFPLYQAFWVAGAGGSGPVREFVGGRRLSPTAFVQYQALRAILRGIPQ